MTIDERIMLEVFRHAKKAYDLSEVPVACAIVKEKEIVSLQYNKKEHNGLATSHAEILAIQDACQKLNRWRLHDCKLYVNLEPCLMCLGAILESRINELFFSVYDYKMGGINGKYGIGEEKLKLTPLSINTGILADENKSLIQDFFYKMRNQKIK